MKKIIILLLFPLLLINCSGSREVSPQVSEADVAMAIVQHIFTSETKNTDDEPGSIRIGVMQVWQLQNGQWVLLARQGYKL